MVSAVKRYQGEECFVDSRASQSMNTKYSSLYRSITWVGMGLMLASLAAWGTFIFGLATTVFADETTASHSNGFLTRDAANYTNYTGGWSFDGSVFIWAGLVVALVTVIASMACVSVDHRDYEAYQKEFGTRH